MGTSLSGISSGGYFATQYQFAHSDEVVGCGVVASGPYWCAQGAMTTALTACMASPTSIILPTLEAKARSYAASGAIAPLDNLKSHKVFLFSGTKDYTVVPGVVKKLETMYENFGLTDIVSDFTLGAGHTFPTDSYGNACGTTAKPYISNCDYDGAGKILQTIYGDLKPRVPSVKDNVKKMDIARFTPPGVTPKALSMDTTMYYYQPEYCNGNCTVHVAFHGCVMTFADIGLDFVAYGGYNEWAEANDIVVLYPFIVKNSFLPQNPNGCWDWWGYYDVGYSTKTGGQIRTIRNIIKHFEGAR